jgi:hypothetical protein
MNETKEKKAVVAGRGTTVGVVLAGQQTGRRLALKKDLIAGARTAWYLKHEGEFAAVTEGHENLALGITKLEPFLPTPAQEAAGILCKIRMHSLTGTDENITIRESERIPGQIYLQMSGAREVGKTETQKGQWYNDRKITKAVEAQILSFVNTLLVTVD